LTFIKALLGNNVTQIHEDEACYSAASAKRGTERHWQPLLRNARDPPRSHEMLLWRTKPD